MNFAQFAQYADTAFLVGLVFIACSVASLISAYAHNRSLRGPALLTVLGGAAMAFAISSKPGGYKFTDATDLLLHSITSLIG